MNPNDAAYMAKDGIISWSQGVIEAANELSCWLATVSAIDNTVDFNNSRRRFQRHRLYFLTASNMLFEYVDWAIKLDSIPSVIFDPIVPFRSHVKELRNNNMHVVEYFQGGGHAPVTWRHSDADGISDGSATVGTKIGGRLDWVDFATKVERILEKIV